MTISLRAVLTAALLPGALLLLGSGPGSGRGPWDGRISPPRGRTACGCAHACSPASYQGCGCGSVACFPGGDRLRELRTDGAASTALARQESPAPCVDGLAAGAFPCQGVSLQSFAPLGEMSPGAISGSSLWGFADLDDGREYAVFGLSNGTAIVDVTDPASPVVVGSVPGPPSIWREVKVYQVFSPAQGRYRAYAYVVSEAPTAGLQILDLTELPRQVSLAATYRGFDTAHTVTLANVDPATGAANGGIVRPVLYLEGARNPVAGIAALDLADPIAPALLGTYTQSYGHDIWTGVVSGPRASACGSGHDPCEIVVNWAGDAIRVLDWTDKANPVIISELRYAELGYAHSGWISADGNFLFSMDEFDERNSGANSRVRVLSVADWRNPFVASQWIGSTPAIEHNGYTKGGKFFIAHYERGLTILDVSDPTAPREVGFFDTYTAGDTPNFHGAWGVYPFLPSGNILLSNIDGAGGLYVLKEAPPSGVPPRAPVLRARPRSSLRSAR